MKRMVTCLVALLMTILLCTGCNTRIAFSEKESSRVNEIESPGVYEESSFSQSTYQVNVDYFLSLDNSDINVGPVDSEATAIEKARVLWLDRYDYIKDDPVMDYDNGASYDSVNKCWHVYVKLPLDCYGGGPNAIIREDGKVLALWLEP